MLSSRACPAILLGLFVSLSVSAQGTHPRDNQAGRWLNYATGPIQPILESRDATQLFQIHQPGSRLVIQDAVLGSTRYEVPTGPGLVSIAEHPTRPEVWAVDAVTSSISVIDLTGPSLIRTIRVGAEPHGIAFVPDGSRAYVTCSAADQVDVIDTQTYERIASLGVPVRTPRGIVYAEGMMWVVPFRSGNGTAPRGASDNTDVVIEVRHVAQDFPHLNELPDIDALPIRVSDAPSAEDVLVDLSYRGLGTMQFNLHARPGTRELWIPHTEALNTVKGEGSFFRGQVVRNRIAIIDAQGAQEPRWIDLDQLVPDRDQRCAEPTGVAFAPDGKRAFVFGYGSDSVLVIDLAANGDTIWAGTIRIQPIKAYPDGAGPRMGTLSRDGRRLFVHNKAENSTVTIPLEDLPSEIPFTYTAKPASPIGYNPTPKVILQGRADFIRTQHSGSMTSACNSCHVDGHTDGLAWDLGVWLDPEGTSDSELEFPLDDKGPMVTQTLRRLKEVGPYHWRGEKKTLSDFSGAIVNLLERTEDGQPQDLGSHFQYIVQYMEHLAWYPNPLQAEDRELRPIEQLGSDVFHNKPVFEGLTCADCHPLPMGTGGEIVAHGLGSNSKTIVVPSLRGLFDKVAERHFIGGDFGTRTVLGAGLMHGGSVATLLDHATQSFADGTPRFDLTMEEAEQLEAFLLAFDTGLAPATGFQTTLHADTTDLSEMNYLLEQAAAGNCEVVFRYGPAKFEGRMVWFSGQYDPASDSFLRGSETLAPFTRNQLVSLAAKRQPVTLVGVPLMMGYQMGLDRDLDGLLDLDEILTGTDFEVCDTDEDGLPDGYELLWGTDPLQVTSGTADAVGPELVTTPRIVYSTQNAARIELEFDEATRVLVSRDGGPVFLRLPLQNNTYDTHFSFVVSQLDPGSQHTIELLVNDPSGNTSWIEVPVTTQDLVLPEPVSVRGIELELAAGNTALTARVDLSTVEGVAAASGYIVQGTVYRQGPEGLSIVLQNVESAASDAEGQAIFDLPLGLDAGARGALLFFVEDVQAPAGAARYVEGDNSLGSATIELY